MSADVLVLNKNFAAIQTMDWQKVFSLVWQGHAEVVDQDYQVYDFEEWAELSKLIADNPSGYVHTVNFRLAIPDVIRLTRYERLPNSEVKFTRSNIYQHYKYTCCYCGIKYPASNLNHDHVIPRSRGGATNWHNIVLSCLDCNAKKANRTPEEAGMKLLVQPSRPRFKGVQHALVQTPFKVRESWQRFIDFCYWNSDIENN